VTSTAKILRENKKQVVDRVYIPESLRGQVKWEVKSSGVSLKKVEGKAVVKNVKK
jgi:hypothetical protein